MHNSSPSDFKKKVLALGTSASPICTVDPPFGVLPPHSLILFRNAESLTCNPTIDYGPFEGLSSSCDSDLRFKIPAFIGF